MSKIKRKHTANIPKNARLKPRDVLRDLYRRKLTPAQAYRIRSQILDSPQAAEWPRLMGLSHIEATASMHSAPFEVIAKWRYEGWPDTCARCGRRIDIPAFGWWAGHRKKGQQALRHIVCPKN